jgi:hypothetical protein
MRRICQLLLWFNKAWRCKILERKEQCWYPETLSVKRLFLSYVQHDIFKSQRLCCNCKDRCRVAVFAAWLYPIISRSTCMKWSNIKSHKIRSVAKTSRHPTTRLDGLFINELEGNGLCLIFYRNKTELTRDRPLGPWSGTVWPYEIRICDGKRCCYSAIG